MKDTSIRMITSLRGLLFEQLGDLQSAEVQQLNALPRLRDKARAPELRSILDRHITETAEHMRRLDRIFTSMQETRRGVDSKGMEALIAQTLALCDRCAATKVMDAAIITAVQQINHYEVAGYGAACAFANELNAHEIAALLHETLNEVKDTDKLLSALAKQKINGHANVAASEPSRAPHILGFLFNAY